MLEIPGLTCRRCRFFSSTTTANEQDHDEDGKNDQDTDDQDRPYHGRRFVEDARFRIR